MRLHEFLEDDEWKRLQQLIYSSVWQALSTYQKQRAAQYTPKPLTTKLKPAVAKKARALAAHKAKRPPHAAPPKPLPKPQQQPQPQASTTPAYRPNKAPTTLPADSKTVAARAHLKPPPQSAKIPASMQPLPSGQVAMIHAKTDPTTQKIADKERG